MLVPATGFAQDNDDATTKRQDVEQKIEEKKREREDRLTERQAKRCEFTQVRLEAHKEKIDGRVDARLARYQSVVRQLNTLALRIENNDGDASKLRNATGDLSELISQFEADYQLYIAEVQDAVNNACNDTTQLKSIVGKALAALRTAKADAAEIKAFVNDEIKPLLKEIRTEVSTEAANEEEATRDTADQGSSSVEETEGEQ